MKKKISWLWAIHLAAVLFHVGSGVLFSFILADGFGDSLNRDFFIENLAGFTALSCISWVLVFIAAGITSLVRRGLRKKTWFWRSLLVGFSLSWFSLLIMAISIGMDYVTALSYTGLVVFILSIACAVVHACLYERIGFFFWRALPASGRLARVLIEQVFKVKIVSRVEYYRLTGDDGSTSGQESKSHRERTFRFPKFIKVPFRYARKHVRIIIIAVIVLAVSAGLFTGGFTAWRVNRYRFQAVVEEWAPRGETGGRAVIRVQYSSPLVFADSETPGRVFTIKPELNGVYSIRGNTVIFTPDRDLDISTRYTVTVNTGRLKSIEGKLIQGKRFSFNTRMFEVESADFYYITNNDTGMQEELLGEVTFTLPVSMDSLEERVSVKLDGKDLPFVIEQSEYSNACYLRISGIEQGDDAKSIMITLKKGIMPVSGTIPLTREWSERVSLAEKSSLTVENLESFPIPGSTYVAIKFNYPVPVDSIASFITIRPEVNYTVSSEYRYVILEADFKVNTDYRVTVDSSLQAVNGLQMKENFVGPVYVTDMDPSIQFTTDGKILPRSGNLNLEFTSINLDEVTFSVEKVYKNNLVNYLRNEYSDNRKYLYTKTLPISGGQINEEIRNLVNLRELQKSDYSGLYYLSLSDPRDYYNYSRMFIHVTDTGLIAKNSGNDLLVYAVNIGSLAPRSGVMLTLISRENQVLYTARTDQDGKALFKNYQNTTEGLIPYMVLAEIGSDFTYLTLSRNQLDWSNFDVAGTGFTRGSFEAFLSTERGLYRPGETVYATIIVRTSSLELPGSLPVLVKAVHGTGEELFEQTVMIDDDGMAAISIPTSMQEKTGEYSLKAYGAEDTLIGTTSFKIEEFIPHTIEVAVDLVEKSEKGFSFAVSAVELHGAPASGLSVYSEAIIKSQMFSSKKHDEYRFYNDNLSGYYQQTVSLGDGELDNMGRIVYDFVLPANIRPPSMLQVIVYAEVTDGSGRPVSGYLSLPVDVYDAYYGVAVDGKRPFSADNRITVDFVALNPEKEEISVNDIQVTVERKVWYSIFKKFSWISSYSSESYEEIVLKKTVDIDGRGSISFTPDRGGKYTVSIGNRDGMKSTRVFDVYDETYRADRDLSEPSKLRISLDRDSYVPGDTAYVTIESPFDGKCLFSVEREKVYSSRMVTIKGGRAVLPVLVDADAVPNIYVTAMAFRKPEYELSSLPPVSYGAVNISLDKEKTSQKSGSIQDPGSGRRMVCVSR
jgi:hypothetical protein